MVISKTLVIKHLPGVLDEKEKEDFLKYFGAREIRFLRSQYNKYNVAFARFENERTAENVLHRLHQTTFLGHCLSVEFANDTSISSSPGEQNLPVPDNKETNDRYYDQFLDKLSCWHSGFNFKLPVPNHLKYQYPPPNAPILINILKVLVAVPKFYTQVLHLMNKMNLPCPLGREVLAEVDFKFDSLSWADTLLNSKPGEKAVTTPPKPSSESEISTDEELTPETTERTPKKQDFIMKTKRWLSKMKRPLPATRCAKAHKTKFEDVFEKPTSERETKKIKLNYSGSVFHGFDQHSVPGRANDQPELNNSGFGYLNPITKPGLPDKEVVRDEREEERWSQDEIICIKESELTNNRIPEKDRSVLPVFQNYTEGVPTCRLYIKNLAKTVMETDLRYIYHRYLPNTSELDGEPSMFDIRLMQEGRMKGQAFVTLQTVELAQKALKETNGYILKNKPLVVQFARSAPK